MVAMNQKSASLIWSSRMKILTLTLACGFCLSATCKAHKLSLLNEGDLYRQKRSGGNVNVRVARSANCSSQMITPDMTLENLLPIKYSAEDLDACVSDDLLKNNLTQLGNLAFSKTQLQKLKNRLDKLYPDGLEESVINNLGFIISVYSTQDITKWKITNPNTLAAVLQNIATTDLASIIVENYYQELGELNVTALNAISGPLLCKATEAELRTISSYALRNAKPLDISMCTQAKKDILYNIAKDMDRNGNLLTSYNQSKSYLGGAAASDLKVLAGDKVNMDFETFKKLNPEELVKLSAQEVKDLFGMNLFQMKENELHPNVQGWIRTHSQAEVQSLGVGLSGGQPAKQSFETGHYNFQEVSGISSASSNNFGLLISVLVSVTTIATQRLL